MAFELVLNVNGRHHFNVDDVVVVHGITGIIIDANDVYKILDRQFFSLILNVVEISCSNDYQNKIYNKKTSDCEKRDRKNEICHLTNDFCHFFNEKNTKEEEQSFFLQKSVNNWRTEIIFS